jgi:hypothetical protein
VVVAVVVTVLWLWLVAVGPPPAAALEEQTNNGRQVRVVLCIVSVLLYVTYGSCTLCCFSTCEHNPGFIIRR